MANVGVEVVDVVGVRRAQQRAVGRVRPRVVGAAKHAWATRIRRLIRCWIMWDELGAPMPADVVVSVQPTVGVAGDQHAFGQQGQDGQPIGQQPGAAIDQADIGQPARAGPTPREHHFALTFVLRLVHIVLTRQRRLQCGHRYRQGNRRRSRSTMSYSPATEPPFSARACAPCLLTRDSVSMPEERPPVKAQIPSSGLLSRGRLLSGESVMR
jgi:hypothetical protein